MPITQGKYASIVSGIGGKSAASRKDLILRLMTNNTLFPLNAVLEFTSAADVADFAGATSTEAKLASAYFGWTSKQNNQPQKISFMRYSLAATAPMIRSTSTIGTLAQFKAVTNGSMVISMGGTSYNVSNVNFSTATDYASVASALQTAIRANTEGGNLWTNATVTFNADVNAFILTGGANGANVITPATAYTSGTDISSMIGWSETTNPVLSNGTAIMTIGEVLSKTIEVNNNFASYAFIGISIDSLNADAIGAFNDEQNYQYLFCFDIKDIYPTIVEAAKAHKGMSINYQPYDDELPAYLMPATILAATNYNKVNGTVNYMFQQFPNQAVTVDTNPLSQTLDGYNINYNGQTQKAGAKIEFYQDGFLADGTDIAVYANEIWLKDAIITEILNLEIAVDIIPANDDGILMIQGILEAVIEEALKNGVISVGKPLTNTQKAYITQLTGNDEAWKNVQLNGYVLSVEIVQRVNNGTTRYIAQYSLVYSKGDSIRKVEGTHTLI